MEYPITIGRVTQALLVSSGVASLVSLKRPDIPPETRGFAAEVGTAEALDLLVSSFLKDPLPDLTMAARQWIEIEPIWLKNSAAPATLKDKLHFPYGPSYWVQRNLLSEYASLAELCTGDNPPAMLAYVGIGGLTPKLVEISACPGPPEEWALVTFKLAPRGVCVFHGCEHTEDEFIPCAQVERDRTLLANEAMDLDEDPDDGFMEGPGQQPGQAMDEVAAPIKLADDAGADAAAVSDEEEPDLAEEDDGSLPSFEQVFSELSREADDTEDLKEKGKLVEAVTNMATVWAPYIGNKDKIKAAEFYYNSKRPIATPTVDVTESQSAGFYAYLAAAFPIVYVDQQTKQAKVKTGIVALTTVPLTKRSPNDKEKIKWKVESDHDMKKPSGTPYKLHARIDYDEEKHFAKTVERAMSYINYGCVLPHGDHLFLSIFSKFNQPWEGDSCQLAVFAACVGLPTPAYFSGGVPTKGVFAPIGLAKAKAKIADKASRVLYTPIDPAALADSSVLTRTAALRAGFVSGQPAPLKGDDGNIVFVTNFDNVISTVLARVGAPLTAAAATDVLHADVKVTEEFIEKARKAVEKANASATTSEASLLKMARNLAMQASQKAAPKASTVSKDASQLKKLKAKYKAFIESLPDNELKSQVSINLNKLSRRITHVETEGMDPKAIVAMYNKADEKLDSIKLAAKSYGRGKKASGGGKSTRLSRARSQWNAVDLQSDDEDAAPKRRSKKPPPSEDEAESDGDDNEDEGSEVEEEAPPAKEEKKEKAPPPAKPEWKGRKEAEARKNESEEPPAASKLPSKKKATKISVSGGQKQTARRPRMRD
jgi:hypothetical protein